MLAGAEISGALSMTSDFAFQMMLIICLRATKKGREEREIKRYIGSQMEKEDGRGMNKTERERDEKESEKGWREGREKERGHEDLKQTDAGM